MKRLSIGVRLTLWYLAIFALGEFVFGAGMWFILRENLYDMVDDDLEAQIVDLQTLLQVQDKNASASQLSEQLKATFGIERSGDYVAVYGENGDPLYRPLFWQAHSIAFSQPSLKENRPVATGKKVDGRLFRFVSQRLYVNGHSYTVQIAAPADDAVDTLQRFRAYLLVFSPLLLMLGAGVGYWMSRRALAPVDALVRTARDVSGTNLSSRLQKLETGDELQRLSDTVNEMLDRIEAAFSRVTQFTADASHELRTPVSLIRTEAELALRRPRSEDEYQKSLRHILLEAERTTTLIEQLLSLARADSGQERLHMQSLDLTAVLRDVVSGWQQVAAIRDLRFSSTLEDASAFVTGDETLLRRLADILLDNAFKYTASPGSVSLELEQSGNSAVLTVHDSGLGIAEEEQGKIFERFYRVDKARSRAQGGLGLGLAIADWIVTRHHGSITVQSQPGEGSTFRVELPKIAPPVRNPQPA
jgi:Signal transduction histidine kinase